MAKLVLTLERGRNSLATNVLRLGGRFNAAKPLLYEVPTYLVGCPIGTLNRKTKRKKAMAEIYLENNDALNVLYKLDTESIDLIYCDLPYGTTQCSWDEVIPYSDMWFQIRRIAKKNAPIVFHAQQPFTSALIMSNPEMFKYTWVWEKSKATGFLNAKKRPLVAHEDIVVFCKGTPVYYPQMTEGTAYNKGIRKQQTENDVYGSFKQVEVKSDGLRYPRSVQYFKTAESEGETWHKTQKPKDLCKYIIETYSKQGDTVLDFTMGSGTSGVACAELNRNYIGIEKDIEIFNNAKIRIYGI